MLTFIYSYWDQCLVSSTGSVQTDVPHVDYQILQLTERRAGAAIYILMNIETTWKVKHYFKLPVWKEHLASIIDAKCSFQSSNFFKNTNFTYLFTNPCLLITAKIRYIEGYFITELKSGSFLTTVIGLELLAMRSYFIWLFPKHSKTLSCANNAHHQSITKVLTVRQY